MMWLICIGQDGGPLTPVVAVETQRRAVDLADQLRQNPLMSQVAIIRGNDPCTLGVLLGQLSPDGDQSGEWDEASEADGHLTKPVRLDERSAVSQPGSSELLDLVGSKL